jgi:recombination protein RecA
MGKMQAGAPAAAMRAFETRFAKVFGDKATLRRQERSQYDVISTGSLLLDQATGVGGTIQGRITEIWGPEGTGKTTLALIGIAQAQRANPGAMQGWIDMEQRYDADWAAKLGVDTSRLYLAEPTSAEEVADVTKVMLTSGLMNKVVVDSVGGMVSEGEKEKDAGEVTVGQVPKIVTRMVKIAAVEARIHKVDFWIINQVRARIGGPTGRGADTTRGGGFALGHSSTLRMKTRKTGETLTIGKDDTVVQVGFEVAVKVEKNSVASPGRVARIMVINQATEKFGPIGIDQATEAHTLATQLDLFDRSGSHVTFADGTKVNGREKAIEHIRAHPEIITKIREIALARVAHEIRETPAEEG